MVVVVRGRNAKRNAKWPVGRTLVASPSSGHWLHWPCALYPKSIVIYLCEARAHFPTSVSPTKAKSTSNVIADHFNSVR